MPTAKPKMIVWGAGGHAKVVTDILQLQNQFDIVGYIDDSNPHLHDTSFYKSKIIGGQSELVRLKSQGINHIHIAIGDCPARINLAKKAAEIGFEFVTAIHPQTVIASDVSIGQGSVVVAGAIINPAAKIGEHVIINTAATIDHDCKIADGVHISPGVHLGGGVQVEAGAWIAISATVLPRIIIGKGSIIGAGSVVTKDIPAGVIAYGSPARIIRKITGNML